MKTKVSGVLLSILCSGLLRESGPENFSKSQSSQLKEARSGTHYAGCCEDDIDDAAEGLRTVEQVNTYTHVICFSAKRCSRFPNK